MTFNSSTWRADSVEGFDWMDKVGFFPQQSTKIDLSLSFESSGINRGAQIILTCVNNVCVCEKEIFMAHLCAILYWWKLIIYENKYACTSTGS